MTLSAVNMISKRTQFDPSQYGFENNVRYEFRGGEAGQYSDFFNMFFGGNGFEFDNILVFPELTEGAKGKYKGRGSKSSA